MKKQVSLAGYDSYDVDTLEMPLNQAHFHHDVTMGVYACTATGCQCKGYNPSNWTAICQGDPDNGITCGHGLDAHADNP